MTDCSAKICDFGLARSMVGIKNCEKLVHDYLETHKADLDISGSEDEDEPVTPKMTKSSSTEKMDATKINSPDLPSLGIVKKKASVIRKGSDDGFTRKQIDHELKHKKRLSRALKETQEEREKGDRQLTPHVVTRFFRAPEVILMDKNYNSKIDIWACGTIF